MLTRYPISAGGVELASIPHLEAVEFIVISMSAVSDMVSSLLLYSIHFIACSYGFKLC